jgi:hypothetical protein
MSRVAVVKQRDLSKETTAVGRATATRKMRKGAA